MRGQTGQIAAQHGAVLVVDRLFQHGVRSSRQPGRVADHQRGLSGGKQVGVLQLNLRRQAQALQVVGRAGQRGRRDVGGHHLRDAAPRQHSREHAGAHADVEGARATGQGRWQRRLRDQRQVLATHWRKHAVMRVDVRALQGGQRHALLAPLVRANQALQAAQREHARLSVGRAPGLGAGLDHLGCARQCDAVGPVKLDQQLTQHAHAQGLGLAVAGKALGDVGRGGFGLLALRCRIQALRHALQQLAGGLEVAPPEQAGARAGQAVGAVGVELRHGLHTAGQASAVVGLPKRRSGLAVVVPVQGQGRVHGEGLSPCVDGAIINSPPRCPVQQIDTSGLGLQAQSKPTPPACPAAP